MNNVTVIVGDADDPHLPARVDAVLMVNTYHELTAPKAILDHVRDRWFRAAGWLSPTAARRKLNITVFRWR